MANELADFHVFVGHQLQAGGNDLSPEEALDLWRSQHPSSSADDSEAILESLADLAAGNKPIPIEQFDREFRRQHGIP